MFRDKSTINDFNTRLAVDNAQANLDQYYLSVKSASEKNHLQELQSELLEILKELDMRTTSLGKLIYLERALEGKKHLDKNAKELLIDMCVAYNNRDKFITDLYQGKQDQAREIIKKYKSNLEAANKLRNKFNDNEYTNKNEVEKFKNELRAMAYQKELYDNLMMECIEQRKAYNGQSVARKRPYTIQVKIENTNEYISTDVIPVKNDDRRVRLNRLLSTLEDREKASDKQVDNIKPLLEQLDQLKGEVAAFEAKIKKPLVGIELSDISNAKTAQSLKIMMFQIGIKNVLELNESGMDKNREFLIHDIPRAIAELNEETDESYRETEAENLDFYKKIEARKIEIFNEVMKETASLSHEEYEEKCKEVEIKTNQDAEIAEWAEKMEINSRYLDAIRILPANPIKLPIDYASYKSGSQYISDLLEFRNRITAIKNAEANRDRELAYVGALEGPKNISTADKGLETIIVAFLNNNVTKCEYNLDGDLIVHIKDQPRLNLTRILSERPEVEHLFFDVEGAQRKRLADMYVKFISESAHVKPIFDIGEKIVTNIDAKYLEQSAKNTELDGVEGGYLLALNIYSGPMYVLTNDLRRKEARKFTISQEGEVKTDKGIDIDLRNSSLDQQIKEVLLASVFTDIGIDQAEKLRAKRLDANKKDNISDDIVYRGHVPEKLPENLQKDRENKAVMRDHAATSTSTSLKRAAVFGKEGIISEIIGQKGIDISSVSQHPGEDELLKKGGRSYITVRINTKKNTDRVVEVNPYAPSHEKDIGAQFRYKLPTTEDELSRTNEDQALQALKDYANTKPRMLDPLDRNRKLELLKLIDAFEKEPDAINRMYILAPILNDKNSILHKHHILSIRKDSPTNAIRLLNNLYQLHLKKLMAEKEETQDYTPPTKKL